MLRAVPKNKNYKSSEIAKALNITENALRKYKSYLVKAGITFDKKGKYVIYTEEHLRLLRNMLRLHESGDKSLEECAVTVTRDVARVTNKPERVPSVTEHVTGQEQNQKSEDLQQVVLEDVLKRLTQQEEKYKALEERVNDRDQQLMSVVRRLQKVEAAQQKKKWWQFWK